MPGLDRLRRALDAPTTPLAHPDGARAAVAAVFSRDLELLFIQRATVPGDPWSGHISFPGGRAEPGDPSLQHTAIRETREELGLELEGAEVLGRLDDVTTVSGLPPMIVQPWVFVVPDFGQLAPNREVAAVHRVPLELLLADHGRSTFQLDFRGHPVTMPRVVEPFRRATRTAPDGGAGSPVAEIPAAFLWGMTLRMVDGLLDRLDGRGIGLARLRPG